ncbi:MAG: hypothetical protein QW112_03820 [Candidatus Micrarchaeia archaeon]
MQIPICTFCVKADTLCTHCEGKLREGRISQLDVELSKYLYEKYGHLDIEYVSSFSTKDMAILFFKGNIAPIVGREGRGALEIGERIGKKVKIIDLNRDIKKVISDIIYPVALLGLNTIFTNEGEVSKIRLAKKDLVRIPFDINSMEKVLLGLMQRRIKIAFE